MKRKLQTLLMIAAAGFLPASANAGKHASLPEVFSTAHTVFVEAPDGDITDIRLNPEERAAIVSLQQGVKDWGRYTLSSSRIDADLILVVQKALRDVGRPTSNPGIGGPVATRNPPGQAPVQNPGNASSTPGDDSQAGYAEERDRLQVYTLAPNDKLKGPIWTGELERGLDGPYYQLLRRLKADVEKAYPAQPAKTAPNP